MIRGDLKRLATASLVAGLLVTFVGGAAEAASISVSPHSGPAGTSITIVGSGFPVIPGPYGFCQHAVLRFVDVSGHRTGWGSVNDRGGAFSVTELIPPDATVGIGRVTALAPSAVHAPYCINPIQTHRRFTVTAPAPRH